jgi:hypothetical protein
MAKTVAGQVEIGGKWYSFELYGIANDQTATATRRAADVIRLIATTYGAACEMEGYARGVRAVTTWPDVSGLYRKTKPVEVVKVPSHSHWWKRNG